MSQWSQQDADGPDVGCGVRADPWVFHMGS